MKNNNSTHYAYLKDKWTLKNKKTQKNLWEKHKDVLSNLLTAGSLSGIMFLSSPSSLALPAPSLAFEKPSFNEIDDKVFLVSDLSNILPLEMRALTEEEETKISEVLSRHFNLKINYELEGKRLNRSYGLIGAEQHLARYPGDTMASHFDPSTGSGQAPLTHLNSSGQGDPKIYSSGMAPGLGAWRYFANSRQDMTEKDKLREKYYIAVQTFLAPGFMSRTKEYVDFFKFRKMLVVNPENGNAVVAVIGDAGPSEWTGKHLGGSPEVMKQLERVDGSMRGRVLYFFIDDPLDRVPLGPKTNLTN